MGNVEFNSQYWDGLYNWTEAGEEWSVTWGGSRAQWLGSLYPRISTFLPSKAVLEIAPGFGRWTQFLLGACEKYQGVDLSQECVDACQKRFGHVSKASFVKNDGKSLECAKDGSVDFLFSFDSLVHATRDVLAAYIPEILRVLSPNGAAFIHHSNWLEVGESLTNDHGRGTDVSADLVSEMVSASDGQVLIREKITWGHGDACIDCLTLFRRQGSESEPVLIENHEFMLEARNIRKFQSPYSRLSYR
jgi:SAM-dependent methyltransferase